tara:strand:- start:242 stop:679 length:438 start_codon:yes stop_codon:yes gene_type:complete
MKPKKQPKYKKANSVLRNTIFDKYSKTFSYPTDTWSEFHEQFRARGSMRPDIKFDIGSNIRRYDSYEAGYHDGIADILWHMKSLEAYHFGRLDEYKKNKQARLEEDADNQKIYDEFIENYKKELVKKKEKKDTDPYNWFTENKGI